MGDDERSRLEWILDTFPFNEAIIFSLILMLCVDDLNNVAYISRFPQIVQRACADGTPTIQKILANDRCLFNGITITEVKLPKSPASLEELSQYEASEHITNEQQLKIMMDRGQFRQLSSSDDPADKFLVYTPNTLPYNPSAPLRNTVPYIPLQFTEKGVSIDPIIPDEYINPSVKRFLDNISNMLTPEQISEQQMIREQLGLDHIRSELCHLGSVVEDDVRI